MRYMISLDSYLKHICKIERELVIRILSLLLRLQISWRPSWVFRKLRLVRLFYLFWMTGINWDETFSDWFRNDRLVSRKGWLFNLKADSIVWPKLSFIMEEIGLAVSVQDITREACQNTTGYAESTRNEEYHKLLPIVFEVWSKYMPIINSSIVGGCKNGTDKTLEAK